MRVHYFSAPCGSGKTYTIVHQAIRKANEGGRVLILQPTKELIERTVQRELLTQKYHPSYTIFHGDKVSGSVASQLAAHLKQSRDQGQIVFATHQVLHLHPAIAHPAMPGMFSLTKKSKSIGTTRLTCLIHTI